MKTFGEAASAETLHYLKCSLMHEILCLILNEKFMNAYVHGIIVKCGDGILWRLFPRFFCYIADYPEKCMKQKAYQCQYSPYMCLRILLACIRFLASCPCPQCFTKKKDIMAMGTTVDTQRHAKVRRDDEHTRNKIDNTCHWIFEKGLSTESAAIEHVLGSESLVPIRVGHIHFISFYYLFIFVS